MRLRNPRRARLPQRMKADADKMRIGIILMLICAGCARHSQETPTPLPTAGNLTGNWSSDPGYTVYSMQIKQDGTVISGHGTMNTCVTQGVPFTVSGTRTGDVVVIVLDSRMKGLAQSNTYRIAFTHRGQHLFLDAISTSGCDEPCGRLFADAMFEKFRAQQGAAPLPSAPQTGPSEGAR